MFFYFNAKSYQNVCSIWNYHQITFLLECSSSSSTPRAIKIDRALLMCVVSRKCQELPMCVVFEMITKKNYIPFKIEFDFLSSTPRAINMCVVFENNQ